MESYWCAVFFLDPFSRCSTTVNIC